MGISITPATWILNLSKNDKERDLKIAEYLDQIADEAIGLAKIWENVAESILRNGIVDAENNLIWVRLVERPEWTIYSKTIPKSRLEIFYDRVSSVIGKNHRNQKDFLICKIGAILQKKKLTKEIIEHELKKVKDARLFDKNIQLKDETSIGESIALLNQEVAALSVFANEFRTQI